MNQETEKKIISLIANGLRSKEVAEITGLKTRTVETYIQELRRLYGARNTTHLISIAYQRKILN